MATNIIKRGAAPSSSSTSTLQHNNNNNNSSNNPREQQLLIRTVQQEVELKALRAKVRMLEDKVKNTTAHHHHHQLRQQQQLGESAATATATTNADGTTTSTAAEGPSHSSPRGPTSTTTSTLLSPIVAEEILPDTDGLVRPPTHHHSALVLGTSIYLFGGQQAPDARGFSAVDSDVWSFSLERRCWRRVEVSGGASRLRGRTRHSAVGYKGSMFVYGGNFTQRGRTVTSNSLHSFSPASGRWFDVPMTPPGEPLADHTAASVQDVMYIFGGINASGRNNIVRGIDLGQRTWLDVHTLNPQITKRATGNDGGDDRGEGASPTHQQAHGGGTSMMTDVPAPRSGHSAVTWHHVIRDALTPEVITNVVCSMVVFGGSLADSVCANDCFLYNYRTNMWSRLFCGGDVPEPRCEHTATCAKDFMFVCGGVGSNKETHVLGGSDRDGDDDEDGEKDNDRDFDDDEDDDDDDEDEEEEEERDDTDESGGSDDESDREQRRRRRRTRSRRRNKKLQLQLQRQKLNRPRLFNDVYALNLSQSIWRKIDVTTVYPSLLCQCGHSSLLYQSPENYIAMLTFGGITVERSEEEEEKQLAMIEANKIKNSNSSSNTINSQNKDMPTVIGKSTSLRPPGAANATTIATPTTTTTTPGTEKNDEGLASSVSKQNQLPRKAADAPSNPMISELLSVSKKERQLLVQQQRAVARARKNRSKHRHREHITSSSASDDDEDSDKLSSTAKPSSASDRKQQAALKASTLHEKDNSRSKELEADLATRNPIVGGGIFVMRLISTEKSIPGTSSNPQEHFNHRPMTPMTAPSGGFGPASSSSVFAAHHQHTGGANLSRPTSARSSKMVRPASAASSTRGGSGSRPTTSRPNSPSPVASQQQQQQHHPSRWITTGSHVLDRDETLRAQAKPRPPPSRRSEEEMERFFKNLNERTKAQRQRMAELRSQYLRTEEPARFASSEDEDASVSRLYFDAIQHREQTYADLEEMYAPGNPVKIVEPAVIGETVERLYANTSPTSASKMKSERAKSPPSDVGGTKKTKDNYLSSSKKGGGADVTEHKTKKITPQEEKDAVQRLYYLSLEFRKRREKELIDKHLFQGYKSPAKVDANALVERLYAAAAASTKK